MRVGVDGRSLVGGDARGVTRYTLALLEALAAAFPQDEYRVLLPRGPVAPLPPGLEPVRSPLPSRALFGAAAVTGRPRLDRLLGGGLDVVWVPAPAPVAVAGSGPPYVLTVHDPRPWEQRPWDFTRYERLWHRLARPRALARGASRVLCVSEAVRADVVGAWGLDPGRVRTTLLAPTTPALPAAPDAGAPPHFLFAGAFEPRKAPDVLVRAFALACSRGLQAELWMAGEGRLAAALEAPGVRHLGWQRPADLPRVYAGALALVFPSLLEGFGLPTVEALRAGVPVIASDLPVLREVLSDDGALWFPPGDVEALADALERVERDPELREGLLRAGRAATASLSWAGTARATRAVLAEAATCE
jgi:glycosyltransferase involved in cell wall biosynthesis